MSSSPPSCPNLESVSAGSLDPLREQFKALRAGDWCHQFELGENGQFVPADNLRYRHGVLDGVFRSLFRDRTVLVLDEWTGIFPVMISRAGARSVSANHVNPSNCDLIRGHGRHFGIDVGVRNQALVRFEKPNVLVDLQEENRYAFLFSQNRLWSLYAASGHSFDDVVAACSHYVSDGMVFDWNDARWANPPADYTRENFHQALLRRFEYVIGANDWLTIALGKLPEVNAVGEVHP